MNFCDKFKIKNCMIINNWDYKKNKNKKQTKPNQKKKKKAYNQTKQNQTKKKLYGVFGFCVSITHNSKMVEPIVEKSVWFFITIFQFLFP